MGEFCAGGYFARWQGYQTFPQTVTGHPPEPRSDWSRQKSCWGRGGVHILKGNEEKVLRKGSTSTYKTQSQSQSPSRVRPSNWKTSPIVCRIRCGEFQHHNCVGTYRGLIFWHHILARVRAYGRSRHLSDIVDGAGSEMRYCPCSRM